VAQHHALWRCAQEQIAALGAALATQPPPIATVAARLQTVPGVGPLTSLTAVAVFSDVHRFPSAKHATSSAGLVPSTNQSGERDTHGPITKRGSAALRTMLCEAAHHAQRPAHPLHPYFARRCAQRGYKMAVVAVAHRLCRILFALLRDGVAFDIAKLAVEDGPFQRTCVQRYRLKRAPARRGARKRGHGQDDAARADSAYLMTTLTCEHVTPERLMSLELRISCGAVLPATKRGAAVSTPNGRLVSEAPVDGLSSSRTGRTAAGAPRPRSGARDG
jgi:hypothetical protein